MSISPQTLSSRLEPTSCPVHGMVKAGIKVFAGNATSGPVWQAVPCCSRTGVAAYFSLVNAINAEPDQQKPQLPNLSTLKFEDSPEWQEDEKASIRLSYIDLLTDTLASQPCPSHNLPPGAIYLDHQDDGSTNVVIQTCCPQYRKAVDCTLLALLHEQAESN